MKSRTLLILFIIGCAVCMFPQCGVWQAGGVWEPTPLGKYLDRYALHDPRWIWPGGLLALFTGTWMWVLAAEKRRLNPPKPDNWYIMDFYARHPIVLWIMIAAAIWWAGYAIKLLFSGDGNFQLMTDQQVDHAVFMLDTSALTFIGTWIAGILIYGYKNRKNGA